MKTLYRGKIFTFTNKATLANLQGLVPDSLFVNDERFIFYGMAQSSLNLAR